jgi:hypothetical protein
VNSPRAESIPPRGWKTFGIGLLAGFVAALVMTMVVLLLRSLFGLATPMSLIGDRLSALIPVGPFLDLMGKVGGDNHMKQLGVSSVIAGQLVLGSLGAWIYAILAGRPLIRPAKFSLFTAGFFIFLQIIIFAAALRPVLGTHFRGLPIGLATVVTLVGLLLSFTAFERTLVWSYGWLTRPFSRSEPDRTLSRSCRRTGGAVFVRGGHNLERPIASIHLSYHRWFWRPLPSRSSFRNAQTV